LIFKIRFLVRKSAIAHCISNDVCKKRFAGKPRLHCVIAIYVVACLCIYTGCATPIQKERIKRSRLEQGDALFEKGKYAEAFDYYKEGIPFIPLTYREAGGREYMSNTRIRISTFGEAQDDSGMVRKISVDTTGEECFYKAMDCQVRLGHYNYVLSQYEKYIDYLPNYSRMDRVVDNIKFFISKYEEWGEKAAAVRGFKLLLRIDRFSIDGRNAYFAIADYYFAGENYLEAVEYYKDIKLYFPGDKRIPEVLYRMGISYFREFNGIYYDFKCIEKSTHYFKRYLSTGDTEYRKNCEKYLARINEIEAERIYYKGAFYLRREEYSTAKMYFEEVRNEYKNTPWAVKAVQQLQKISSEKQ